MSEEVPAGGHQRVAPSKAVLVRDIAALQVKLLVDGFRDLLLVPASLIAGLVSLLRGGPDVGYEFYELLKLGRRSERWINLFGALDRVAGQARDHVPAGEDIDSLVARVESFVVEEYRHGHLSAQARDQLERAVERLKQAAGRHRAE